MELIFIVLAAIVVIVFAFKRIIEPAYMLVFHRPVYVHLYLFPKKLPQQQEAILHQHFSFYRNLSPQRKIYFQHRVHSFIENYNFAGREIDVTDEMKLKIAATSVMLTFGIRKYLYDVFKAVVIYPGVYESPKDGELHKGEFNPALGVIVFSWHDFEQGLLFDNDNLNLGLHEFAHALHFDSLSRRRPGASAVMYRDMFDEIMEYIADPDKRKRLVEGNYFRSYAFTNQHEFMAVILEYFFETPREFKQKFPELYKLVKRMINFRED